MDLNRITTLTKSPREPSLLQALICIVGIFLTIALGLLLVGISIHILVFLCIIWVSIHAAYLNYSYTDIQHMMSDSIHHALPAIYIFILMGMVIASFMYSGTIASLIYYGLSLLTPSIFLPVGLILCCLMSIATGTSWGTVGTIGVVLIGIADAIHIPIFLAAGMIVSGATFGDKLSPLSDTTNLAAMTAGVGLYQHIYAMVYTTLPSLILALGLFSVIGLQFAGSTIPIEQISEIQIALASLFHLDLWITLLPLICMLVLSLLRFSPAICMTCSIVIAVIISILYQDKPVVEVLNALWLNTPANTGIENIDALLGRGGIYNMAWTLILSIMALALGGVLYQAKFLAVLINSFINKIRRFSTLVATTITAGFVSNLGMGEAYISIILNCQLFKALYTKLDLHHAILSRSVEEGTTVTTPLIPWTTAGAFYAATLSVAVLDYAPYAFFNLLNPIVSVLMAIFGIGLLRGQR
ncbi:MAG: Na+/H+ antiporter NhaC [Nitrosomonas sp.]|nr:Na+/H+ antiporter NhaC [Nitrosomonas sp.]